jgi:DNA (cytosine-5)-methyltransferase 1
VPNLGDMSAIDGRKWRGKIDILAGGTPCQSFSLAGRRRGLRDQRGNLMLHFARLAHEARPQWLVWENVPGVLSSNKGRDFACLLSALVGWDVHAPAKSWDKFGVVTGAHGRYGVAWRITDAQFTRVDGYPRAVPQRRRRVWLVGYLGDWRRALEVLFESPSLLGHTPPQRTLQKPAPACAQVSNKNASRFVGFSATIDTGISSPNRGSNYAMLVAENVRCAFIAPKKPCKYVEVSPTLDSGSGSYCNGNQGGTLALIPAKGRPTVRRFTPLECERLTGLPDNWTRVPYRHCPASQCPDGPRYLTCGNAWAVNSARWVLRRLAQGHAEAKQARPMQTPCTRPANPRKETETRGRIRPKTTKYP